MSDNQYAEFIQKMRNNKELEIKEKIKNEMRPKIFKEIYSKEYDNILENVKIEIEKELSDELNKKLNEEINYIKKRQNYFQKTKENEIKQIIINKVKYEFNEELNKELLLKDKELKLRYTQRYENYKKKLDKDLNTEFEKNKKQKQKEIDNIKSLIYRSKYNEKMKINKINNLKKNIKCYNDEKTDKMLISEENNMNDYYPNNEDENILYNNNNENEYQEEEIEQDELLKNENNFNNKDNFEEEENEKMEPEKDINIDNYNEYDNNEHQINNNISQNRLSFMRNNRNNSVNLAEINNRIKFNSGRKKESNTVKNSIIDNEENENLIEKDIRDNNIVNIYNRRNNSNINNSNSIIIQKNNSNNNSFSYKNISLINNIKNSNINKNIINNNIEINDSKLEKKNLNEKEKKLTENIKSKNPKKKNLSKKEITNKNTKLETEDNNIKSIFYSIQIDKNIPISITEFGKYLINHIEKEEKYKILYLSEIKQLKTKIKKIFIQSKKNDHCLTEFMIELWDKIDTSYFTRYQILKQLIHLSPLNLYTFLDRETEYLTNYFQITQIIFSQIKKRENLKSKLQVKANKNELLSCDREELDYLTNNLDNNIKSFKQKFKGLDIIWKGIRYEWFMNYENWYYEMEQNI